MAEENLQLGANARLGESLLKLSETFKILQLVSAFNTQNIEQIRSEAQYRWLRPEEICDTLTNYYRFPVHLEVPKRPPSGSVFIFNSEELRHFRKDGHNWRKAKDGKPAKEGHEKFKCGLHCYYARGEENKNFLRRIYRLHGNEQSHVLVHYREVEPKEKVKCKKMKISHVREPQLAIPGFQRSEEDGRNSELANNQQSTSGVHSFDELQPNKTQVGLPASCCPAPLSNDQEGYSSDISGTRSITPGNQSKNTANDFPSQDIISEKDTTLHQSVQFQPSPSAAESVLTINDLSNKEESENHVQTPEECQLDSSVLSLSRDQLFSIIDFSPTWAYAGTEVKVLISGRFLMSHKLVEKYNWACVFGEMEVPAESIADGVLRCHTPFQKAGRVPFYITCSDKLACSEVREFEFRVSEVQNASVGSENSGLSDDSLLHMRFEKLISLESVNCQNSIPNNDDDTYHIIRKINSLLKSDKNEVEKMKHFFFEDVPFASKTKDQLVEKLLLKKNLCNWLIQKVAGGEGANILDEGGQGVLHFAGALGYDWVVPATIAAGVNVDLRDVNGWSALHWAAFYGREWVVRQLISLGAAAGALTDPTSRHPLGRTPADLASSSGHEGIAVYLAEATLSNRFLELEENEEGNTQVPGLRGVQMPSEQISTPLGDGDSPDGPSLKDSVAAVPNNPAALSPQDENNLLMGQWNLPRLRLRLRIGENC